MPNAELNGDRRNDAYLEKLRRTVEAIQEYNAGRNLTEQFVITGSLLRQLVGVTPRLVKLWMNEHAADLDAYNDRFGPRQNTSKLSPRLVELSKEVLTESSSILDTAKLLGENGLIFQGFELGLRKRIVIGNMRRLAHSGSARLLGLESSGLIRCRWESHHRTRAGGYLL